MAKEQQNDFDIDFNDTAPITLDEPSESGVYKGTIASWEAKEIGDNGNVADKITVAITEGPQAGTTVNVTLWHPKATHKDGGRFARSLMLGAMVTILGEAAVMITDPKDPKKKVARKHSEVRALGVGKPCCVQFTTKDDSPSRYSDAKVLSETAYKARLAYQTATGDKSGKSSTAGARSTGTNTGAASSDDDIPF